MPIAKSVVVSSGKCQLCNQKDFNHTHTGDFSYPELKEADKNLSNPQNPRQPYVQPGEAREAFGNLLDKPDFVKQLKRLQEKHRLRGIA